MYDRGDKMFYRVRVGAFKTLEDAVANEAILIQDGYPDAFMVAE
jgi:rare lipoprotein A